MKLTSTVVVVLLAALLGFAGGAIGYIVQSCMPTGCVVHGGILGSLGFDGTELK